MSSVPLCRCGDTTATWHEGDDRIRVFVANSDIRDENAERPGLQLAVSSNWRSADYAPLSFNRLGRYFDFNGEPMPVLAEPGDRRLKARLQRLIDWAFEKDQEPTPPSSKQATYGFPYGFKIVKVNPVSKEGWQSLETQDGVTVYVNPVKGHTDYKFLTSFKGPDGTWTAMRRAHEFINLHGGELRMHHDYPIVRVSHS